LAILVTYARLPVSEFYHVGRDGLAGGAGRALVFLNFPVAFIAIALVGVTVARLFADPGATPTIQRRMLGMSAVLAVGLCLVAAGPGVVRQSDLDARPINVVPAVGVSLALLLTVATTRRLGIGARRPWSRGDALRLTVAGILIFFALPWLLADLGVYIADMPLIGSWFMSKEMLPGHTLRAVHLGHHHGLDGVLMALSALALTRVLGEVPRGWLRRALTGYVALLLVYGLTNAVQDFWGEQVVKRGWADVGFPSMLQPALTPAWGLLLVATAVTWVTLKRICRESESGAPANGMRPTSAQV
jgi:hypothetical protein